MADLIKYQMKRLIYCGLFCLLQNLYAHPTGNMISVGEYALWSYIYPLDDPDHHACIMIWSQGNSPEIFIKSEHPASDYMLYNRGEDIYIIERRYLASSDKFEIRILKTRIGEQPVEIWRWFEDNWRIGEGGFVMPSDEQIIFARFPNIYSLNKGAEPAIWFDFGFPLKRLRAVHNNNLLLIGENACRLIGMNGTIVREWNALVDENVKNAPLNINQIFDADYRDGELLLAYWGKRTFDIITVEGIRKIIQQCRDPETPHWVAYIKNGKLLFASKLLFGGQTPKPVLLLYRSQEEIRPIWGIPSVQIKP